MVQRLRVVEQAHHRALGGRLALGRLLLHEVVDDGGREPRLLVEPAVHDRGPVDAPRLHPQRLAQGKAGLRGAAPFEDQRLTAGLGAVAVLRRGRRLSDGGCRGTDQAESRHQ